MNDLVADGYCDFPSVDSCGGMSYNISELEKVLGNHLDFLKYLNFPVESVTEHTQQMLTMTADS